MRIRGRAGSVNGSSTPLFLDGVPYNGSVNAINPNDIASTTILKDAATAIYGNRGANGVIIITTKRGSKNKTNVSVDVRSGTNMDYLPRYSVIESAERYTEIIWESIRNRALEMDKLPRKLLQLLTQIYLAAMDSILSIICGMLLVML